MAQSSAQREPSMEEILASIRRIIEDSDTGRAPENGLGDAEEPADGFSVVDVDAFRSELRAGNDPLPPRGMASDGWPPRAANASADRVDADRATNGSQAFSMAEIEADLASSQADSSAAAPVGARAPVEGRVADADPGAPTGASAASSAAFEAPSRQAQERHDDEDAELDIAISAALEKATLANEAREQSTWLDRDTHAASANHDAAGTAPRGSIISQQTGRQVAAAFGELSEAFAASRRKSFDELAEEMMRPMLQEWLDNNLPTLVEKLVREEIERIARGAQ